LAKHVFQTIFLDKDGSKDLWSKNEIMQDDIILEKWWKQQSHRWQHYGGTVPWMMMLNGKRHTHFAGAWTILNMHEIGIVSGFAAAYRLGAKYPFRADSDCKRLFALYLGGSHGCRMRKEDREGFFM
jgi:predicted NAD/FAD-binding protein